ncbi:bacterial protein of unknown function (Gcw_chp) [mine drainage metagenome]|uniref:Porin n=1 Tax=mine drainage metagenome TaxID=410659 RepID=A0A1J5S9V1_9ZZZZ
MRKSLLSLAVLSALAMPSLSFAEDAAPAVAAATPDWTFPASVGYVSDYIFRGQSQSWGKGSLQAAIEADHASGFYAGLSMESVSDKWLAGASLETDFFAGFRHAIANTDFGYDVGAIYYAYPGADWNKSVFKSNKNSLNTLEAYAAVNYKWLSLKAGRTITEYFGWNNNNSGTLGGFAGDNNAGVIPGGSTKGSYFYEADASYEVLPTWTASGQLGRQVIADAVGLDITYYKAGVSKAFANGWTVGGFYSGTNEPAAYKNFASLSSSGDATNVAKNQVFVSVFKSF